MSLITKQLSFCTEANDYIKRIFYCFITCNESVNVQLSPVKSISCNKPLCVNSLPVLSSSSSVSHGSRNAGMTRCRSTCRQRTRCWNAICTASASTSCQSRLTPCRSRSCLMKCRTSEEFAIQNASAVGSL